MAIPRIYQPTSLQLNQSHQLDDQASHHLAKVLRASDGDSVILFNGEGGEYLATMTEITKKYVKVMVNSFDARETESPLHITLGQGIARGEKMDTIIQKAVELGVNCIVPLITERCNVRLSGEREAKRQAHWQAVAVSACEQSGRNRLPTIQPAMTLASWISQCDAEQRFVLSPHATHTLPPNLSPTSIAILIGPEGGLSEAEISAAIKQGFNPLRLGPRVLRTETAGLTAIAILQHQYGDLK